METEGKEVEEKQRTAAKLLVMKERETWRGERQQLLAENKNMQWSRTGS